MRMERDKIFRSSILWICLALSWLLTSAACASLMESDNPGGPTPASQRTRTAEPTSVATPQSIPDKPSTKPAEVVTETEVPLSTVEPLTASPQLEATRTPDVPFTTADPFEMLEPRSGGSQYGISPSQVSGEGDSACRWEITFEDDFSGDRLDTSQWDTGYKAGDKEAQYYVSDAFELEDGVLRIRAEERQVRDREYASGIITTQGKFEQQYGRFVIQAKVPVGQGLWPAFWLMPASGDYPPEIDVFEVLGHEPNRMFMSNHWVDTDGEFTSETVGFIGPDFSKDFHVFEIEWGPEEIIWRVDGFERASQTIGVPQEPMFLLVNLAVGGEWPGYPDETTPFPSYFEVDYVRAYAWSCLGANAEEIDDEDVQTD